jgi:hypothetical protein
MNVFFKFAAVFLLGFLLGSPVAAMTQTMHSSAPAGGCHHGGDVPAPQPSNYSCCQAGHNSAILQSQHVQEIVVLGMLSKAKVAALVRATRAICSTQVLSTDEPPGRLPLRI